MSPPIQQPLHFYQVSKRLNMMVKYDKNSWLNNQSTLMVASSEKGWNAQIEIFCSLSLMLPKWERNARTILFKASNFLIFRVGKYSWTWLSNQSMLMVASSQKGWNAQIEIFCFLILLKWERQKLYGTYRHVPSTALLDIKIDTLCHFSQLEPTSFYL